MRKHSQIYLRVWKKIGITTAAVNRPNCSCLKAKAHRLNKTDYTPELESLASKPRRQHKIHVGGCQNYGPFEYPKY